MRRGRHTPLKSLSACPAFPAPPVIASGLAFRPGSSSGAISGHVAGAEVSGMKRWQHRMLAHGKRSTLTPSRACPDRTPRTGRDARLPMFSATSNLGAALSRLREHPIRPAMGLSSIAVLAAWGLPTSPGSVSGAVFYGALAWVLASLTTATGLIGRAIRPSLPVLDRPPTEVNAWHAMS